MSGTITTTHLRLVRPDEHPDADELLDGDVDLVDALDDDEEAGEASEPEQIHKPADVVWDGVARGRFDRSAFGRLAGIVVVPAAAAGAWLATSSPEVLLGTGCGGVVALVVVDVASTRVVRRIRRTRAR